MLVPLRATTAVLPLDESLLIVICPLAVPADVGRNCTCSVIDCIGFSVTGTLPPTIVKPLPIIAAVFTVTGAVPVEVSVNDCVVAVFTKDVAETKATRATDAGRAKGYPLLFTTEPEE